MTSSSHKGAAGAAATVRPDEPRAEARRPGRHLAPELAAALPVPSSSAVARFEPQRVAARRPAPPAAGRRALVAFGGLVAVYALIAFCFAFANGVAAHGVGAPAVALAAAFTLAAVSQIRVVGGVAVVMAMSFAAQIIWAAAAGTTPFGEAAVLWAEARRFAAGFEASALVGASAPGAVAVWGAAIATLGDDIEILRVVAAAFWTAQTWLVWRIASAIPEMKRYALGAAAAFGLAPAAIAFGGVMSAEAVFGVFALAALYAMLSHRRRGLDVSAVLSGALAGVAFLIAPIAVAHLLGLAAVLTIAVARARATTIRWRFARALALLVVGFAAAATPFAILGSDHDGARAIVPSDNLGYRLLLGTNRETVHGYSMSDLERAGFIDPVTGAPRVDSAEAEAEALEIALDRVAADPFGFFVFAVTDKMRRLWGSEREALSWSLESPGADRSAWLDGPTADAARLAADGVFIALLALAAAGAARLAFRSRLVADPTRWVMILAALLTLALAHLLLEARERHHIAFAPLLAVLAPLAVTRLYRVKRRRGVVETVRALTPRLRKADWSPMRIAHDEAGPDVVSETPRERSGAPGTKTRTAPVRS